MDSYGRQDMIEDITEALGTADEDQLIDIYEKLLGVKIDNVED